MESIEAQQRTNEVMDKLLISMGRIPLPKEAIGRRLLKNLLMKISEDCWAAGWMDGLEYSVFHMMLAGPTQYGQREVSATNLDTLTYLLTLTGAWPTWNDSDDSIPEDEDNDPIDWLPLPTWIERYLEWGGSQPATAGPA